MAGQVEGSGEGSCAGYGITESASTRIVHMESRLTSMFGPCERTSILGNMAPGWLRNSRQNDEIIGLQQLVDFVPHLSGQVHRTTIGGGILVPGILAVMTLSAP